MADSSWETRAEPLLSRRGPSDVRVGGVDFSRGLSFYLRHCQDTTLRPARLVDEKIVSRDDPGRLL